MESARQLLSTLGYTVTEVSHMLNYSNASHFSKLFKDHHGVGPKEYQQRYARRIAPEYRDEREIIEQEMEERHHKK